MKKPSQMVVVRASLIKALESLLWAYALIHGTAVPYLEFISPVKCIEIHAYTDAALVSTPEEPTGIGGYVHTPDGAWFQVTWNDLDFQNSNNRDIHFRELLAVVTLVLVFQKQFSGHYIGLWTDNQPTWGMLSSRNARISRPDCAHLIDCLLRVCLQSKIRYWIQHIPGKDNIVADRLSRFDKQPFETLPFSLKNRGTNKQARTIVQRLLHQTQHFIIDKQALHFNDDFSFD